MLSSVESLRRSKSTSSTRSHTRHLPKGECLSSFAQAQAQVAANVAFSRAQYQDSPTNVTLSHGPPRPLTRSQSMNRVQTSPSSRCQPTALPDSLSELHIHQSQPRITHSLSSQIGRFRVRNTTQNLHSEPFDSLHVAERSTDTLPAYSSGLGLVVISRQSARNPGLDSVPEIMEITPSRHTSHRRPSGIQNGHVTYDSARLLKPLGRSKSMKRTLRSEEPGAESTGSNAYFPTRNEKPSTTDKSRLTSSFDIQTNASSVGISRLRKSKSIFSWSNKIPSQDLTKNSPPEGRREPDRELKKRSAPSPAPSYESQGNTRQACQVRTNASPHDMFPLGRMRHRTSLVLTSFRSRQTSGISEPIATVSSTTISDSANGTIQPRKVSSTSSRKSSRIRSKVADYFRRSSQTVSFDSNMSTIPAQQVHSDRQHFDSSSYTHKFTIADPMNPMAETFIEEPQSIGSTQLATSTRTLNPVSSSCVPTSNSLICRPLEGNNSQHLQQHCRNVSLAGTVESLQSKSRVTSWADSTIPDTVADVPGLSDIEEDAFTSKSLGTLLLQKSLKKEKCLEESRRLSSIGHSFFRRLIRRPSLKIANVSSPAHLPASTQIAAVVEAQVNVPEAISSGSTDDPLLSNQSGSYATLPSQTRLNTLNSSLASWRNKTTVRPVHTDFPILPAELKLGMDYSGFHEDNDPASSTLQAGTDYTSMSTYVPARRKPVPGREDNPDPLIKVGAEQFPAKATRMGSHWNIRRLDENGSHIPRMHISPTGSSRALKLQFEESSDSCSPIRTAGQTKVSLDNSKQLSIPPVNEPEYLPDFGCLSPSIYSQATDADYGSTGLMPRHQYRQYPAVGVATIMPSQSYSSASPSPNKKNTAVVQAYLDSSGDWTQWIAQEVADLNTSGVPDRLSLTGFEDNLITSTPPRHLREDTEIIERGRITKHQLLDGEDENLSIDKRPAIARSDLGQLIPQAADSVSQNGPDELALLPHAVSDRSPQIQSTNECHEQLYKSKSSLGDQLRIIDTGGPSEMSISSMHTSYLKRLDTAITNKENIKPSFGNYSESIATNTFQANSSSLAKCLARPSASFPNKARGPFSRQSSRKTSQPTLMLDTDLSFQKVRHNDAEQSCKKASNEPEMKFVLNTQEKLHCDLHLPSSQLGIQPTDVQDSSSLVEPRLMSAQARIASSRSLTSNMSLLEFLRGNRELHGGSTFKPKSTSSSSILIPEKFIKDNGTSSCVDNNEPCSLTTIGLKSASKARQNENTVPTRATSSVTISSKYRVPCSTSYGKPASSNFGLEDASRSFYGQKSARQWLVEREQPRNMVENPYTDTSESSMVFL